jgi:hypothetical protein
MWVRTNATGLRSDRPTDRTVPRGRIRVVCSGDSFTFGYGVSNETAWCHTLGRIDSRIDPVNMGVNGYGVDQAYLRYKRDGAGLEHDVHLVAFIADDFVRMRRNRFIDAAKPELVVDDDRLSVRGVPVPEPPMTRRLIQDARRVARQLRTIELVQKVVPQVRWPTCTWSGGAVGQEDSIRAVSEKVFAALRDLAAERDAALALVYLPCVDEYGAPNRSPWRAFAADTSSRLGIPFIDVVPELNRVPRDEAETFFIGGWADRMTPAGDGHYTIGGNAFVARVVLAKLGELEPVAFRLRAVHR